MQLHKNGEYKWRTYRQRQDDREDELIDRLDSMGLGDYDYCNSGLCRRFIDRGGKPSLDEICEMIELDEFLEKHTKYEELRRAYINTPQYKKEIDSIIKNKKNILEIYDTIKKQAFEKYAIENKDNIHKILSEMPWSLKKALDEIYDIK